MQTITEVYGWGRYMADQKRKLYSCSRKSKKKWYMRIFWFLLDTAVVNAHILECESPNHRPARSIGLIKETKCLQDTKGFHNRVIATAY